MLSDCFIPHLGFPWTGAGSCLRSKLSEGRAAVPPTADHVRGPRGCHVAVWGSRRGGTAAPGRRRDGCVVAAGRVCLEVKQRLQHHVVGTWWKQPHSTHHWSHITQHNGAAGTQQTTWILHPSRGASGADSTQERRSRTPW